MTQKSTDSEKSGFNNINNLSVCDFIQLENFSPISCVRLSFDTAWVMKRPKRHTKIRSAYCHKADMGRRADKLRPASVRVRLWLPFIVNGRVGVVVVKGWCIGGFKGWRRHYLQSNPAKSGHRSLSLLDQYRDQDWGKYAIGRQLRTTLDFERSQASHLLESSRQTRHG